MNYNTLYFVITIVLLLIGIIGGQLFEDSQIRLSYYLLFFLLFVTFSNIYLSIALYASLRNNPGIKGPRGPAGDKGPKGANGVCKFEPNCNFGNCRNLIEEQMQKNFVDYKLLSQKIKEGKELTNSEKKIKQKIGGYVDILNNTCSEYTGSKKDFINIINETISSKENEN